MDESTIGRWRSGFDPAQAGAEMHALMSELYPICRSITGAGVRRTLRRLQQEIPLEMHEVATGTQVFDWTVPREWTLREAWVKDPDGKRIVDVADHTLHVLNYSVGVHRRLDREELVEHLFSLPEHPDWIPYRTSYYKDSWGFCVPHRQLEALPPGEYEVFIDAEHGEGSLTYGEVLLDGDSEDEVLFSCHSCHPSLANDNLSGMMVASFLARILSGLPRRYTYRFLFIPGTIGSITWLAQHEERASSIRHGLVLANLGDPGAFHYKKSRRGDTEIDRLVEQVLRNNGMPYEVEAFSPFGYDERQYCSPGFNLPVGSLTRTPRGRYPEYHTSADDLNFVRPGALGESLHLYLQVVEALELNRRYLNLNPKCEPQLGRRGLYRSVGGADEGRERELALLWVLNYSDGKHDLLDIAERSGLPLPRLAAAVQDLVAAELLRPA
jgi:aminopeptidase-like protein